MGMHTHRPFLQKRKPASHTGGGLGGLGGGGEGGVGGGGELGGGGEDGAGGEVGGEGGAVVGTGSVVAAGVVVSGACVKNSPRSRTITQKSGSGTRLAAVPRMRHEVSAVSATADSRMIPTQLGWLEQYSAH